MDITGIVTHLLLFCGPVGIHVHVVTYLCCFRAFQALLIQSQILYYFQDHLTLRSLSIIYCYFKIHGDLVV